MNTNLVYGMVAAFVVILAIAGFRLFREWMVNKYGRREDRKEPPEP